MMSLRRLALLASVVALAGCANAPHYAPPAMPMPLPAAWDPASPPSSSPPSSSPSSSFHAGVPNDAALKGNWWELFQDAQLNLLEQQALLANQSLRVAGAHLEQARAQVRVSGAALLPQVGMQAGAGRSKSSADRPLSAYGTPNQSTVQNNDQLGLTVSYEADLFGRVRGTVASARASAEQAAADFENARLLLMADLASSYFNLRERDGEIDVVLQGIALQEKAFDFIHTRHELGIASGLDLAQQQSLLDASKTQLELLQNQRAQFVHALATLSGTPAPGFRLAAALVALAPPPVPAGLPSDVLQRRPDVAAAERAVAAANANIGVARAAYFPSVMLQSSGGWDSNQMSQLFSAPSLLWSLGASLAQTLFDAGKTDASVLMAKAAYAGSVASYRQSVLVAMQEVEDGIEGMATLGRASGQAEAAVRSSQRVLELANDRYTGGLATYLDVITAQQTLLTNQRLAVGIRGQQMLTSVFLIKALGGGWQGNGVPAGR